MAGVEGLGVYVRCAVYDVESADEGFRVYGVGSRAQGLGAMPHES